MTPIETEMTMETQLDPEAAAVRHILTSPSIAQRCAPYLSASEIDWTGVFSEAESMSGGEQLLVRAAHDLAAREATVAVWELPERLGRPTFDRVLEALELARGDRITPRFEAVPKAA